MLSLESFIEENHTMLYDKCRHRMFRQLRCAGSAGGPGCGGPNSGALDVRDRL